MRPWVRKTCLLCGRQREWRGDPEVHVRLRVCPTCDQAPAVPVTRADTGESERPR